MLTFEYIAVPTEACLPGTGHKIWLGACNEFGRPKTSLVSCPCMATLKKEQELMMFWQYDYLQGLRSYGLEPS